MMLIALLAGCLNANSQLELTVNLSEAALDSLPAFPVDLVVDFGKEGSQRTAIQLCERGEGNDFIEIEVDAPLYDRCPIPTRITAILVPHEGVCNTGSIASIVAWPEDEQLARGEIVIFDDEFCDVLEQRTLTVEPLPEE